MANTRSAIKRMKQSEKRRQRNRAVRSTIRSSVKAAASGLDAKSPEARTAVHDAIRTLDQAVSRGVIHKNTAARKKSALARKLNALA
ncbi:MAG: 30S ribosomal protein S20 [Candidatus Rokuibacteriota bacterium]|nr:MAG: 30S ribosomal protein S20 [Candidatus Rokubacteria bacterium]